MIPGRFQFDRFVLDAGNRRLMCDGRTVELNARYLDALALMVREPGALISKERFLDEVWRGVPVTDEALTQCIRTLRRLLGDTAGQPRFIETVVKHGYRFIAPVTAGDLPVLPSGSWPRVIRLGLAGTLGAGLAGFTGGLIYGLAASAQTTGALSVLAVVLCLTLGMALTGGAVVSFAIAVAQIFRPRSLWIIAAGGLGGMLIGAIVKLLGLDAFSLLFGQAPAQMTGAPEGAVLGAAVGFAVWLDGRLPARFNLWQRLPVAGLIGAATGVEISLTGGRLMAGSLALLAENFAASRLRFDAVWRLFGETDFGLVSRMATAGFEGALFAGCIAGAMWLTGREI